MDTNGTGNSIKKYYVAFYDKKEGTNSIQSAYSSIIANPATSDPNAELKTLLSNNYAAGFLLAYDASSSRYYVWDPSSNSSNKWADITGNTIGKPICSSTPCTSTNIYYRVFPGNPLGNPSNPSLPKSWTILFYKNFGGKTMYTAGFVVDNNNLSAYQAEINPQ